MRHAHDGRGANLLGALSVTLADRLRAATDAGARQGGSAPGALISLAGRSREWLAPLRAARSAITEGSDTVDLRRADALLAGARAAS